MKLAHLGPHDSQIGRLDRAIQSVAERPELASRLRRALLASTKTIPPELMGEHEASLLEAAKRTGLVHQTSLLRDEAQLRIASRLSGEIGIPLLGILDERAPCFPHSDVWQVHMFGPSRSLPGATTIVFACAPIVKVRVRLPDSVILALSETNARLFFDNVWYLEPIFARRGQLVKSIAALRASNSSAPVDPLVVGSLGRHVPSRSSRPAGRFLYCIAHWD